MTLASGGAATLTLRSQLDITAASPLAKELLSLRGSDVVIDGSKVERLGAQVVQVLASAIRTWSHDMAQIEIKNPSHAFLEGLRIMGIQSLSTHQTEAQK